MKSELPAIASSCQLSSPVYPHSRPVYPNSGPPYPPSEPAYIPGLNKLLYKCFQEYIDSLIVKQIA